LDEFEAHGSASASGRQRPRRAASQHDKCGTGCWADFADHPSFFEFRFPVTPYNAREPELGTPLEKLAQATIKKRAHAQLPTKVILTNSGLIRITSLFVTI
jgi:hypothetical protein